MKLKDIQSSVEKLIKFQIKNKKYSSIMIWGPPGIGKSSIIKELSEKLEIGFVDVRLSQLAPTDLRGLPSVNKEENTLSWVPPNFLPRNKKSKGILFLDEFNMATGSMQGIAQELILDRRVGDYTLPDGWVIIAAGNRAEDRAAVNTLPAPVANRFIHFSANADLEEFKDLMYNYFDFSDKTKTSIIGFLNFRPELLFNNVSSSKDMAFPTPRSWEMAGNLIDMDIDISHAVGENTAVQYKAYNKICSKLPDIDTIMSGDSAESINAQDPSIVTAIVSSLVSHCKDPIHYTNSICWLINQKITEDYIGLFIKDSILKLNSDQAKLAEVIGEIMKNENTKEFIKKYQSLVINFGK